MSAALPYIYTYISLHKWPNRSVGHSIIKVSGFHPPQSAYDIGCLHRSSEVCPVTRKPVRFQWVFYSDLAEAFEKTWIARFCHGVRNLSLGGGNEIPILPTSPGGGHLQRGRFVPATRLNFHGRADLLARVNALLESNVLVMGSYIWAPSTAWRRLALDEVSCIGNSTIQNHAGERPANQRRKV